MAAETVTCPECGGRSHLMSYAPSDEGFGPGDVIAYVCEDCSHRVDLVAEEEDEGPGVESL